MSTAHLFITVLSKDNLKKYARDCGALKRERKFSISDHILSSLSQMRNPHRSLSLRFALYMMLNLIGYKKLGKSLLTHKCIHKQLQSGNTLEVIKTMLSELMTATFSKSFLKKIKKFISGDLTSLFGKLGVDDIILV